ncbi:hypothetical protein [Rhodobacter sp. NSM]|uniref:hypothetical protein n=1 Tax=Rhodobacter sp. NSM TaxID=3457501 RepID=UPI003FD5A137
MTTPSDTQSLILSRAATRPGNLALPLPAGLVGAAAKMVVGKMIARGWLDEVKANLRRGEPMWRETRDGHGTTLIATEAGLEAIGIEPVVASAVASVRRAKPKAEPVQTPDDTDTAKPVAIRAGTKHGIRQRSCPSRSFSGCLFGRPGHGSAAASFMGERVGGPMASAPGIGPLGVQPDRADGLPVAGLA